MFLRSGAEVDLIPLNQVGETNAMSPSTRHRIDATLNDVCKTHSVERGNGLRQLVTLNQY